MAAMTFFFVLGRTDGWSLMTRETVIRPTFASFATSRMVGRPRGAFSRGLRCAVSGIGQLLLDAWYTAHNMPYRLLFRLFARLGMILHRSRLKAAHELKPDETLF